MSVKHVPEGYHSVTPYLAVKDAAAAIDWYREALGATEVMRMEDGGRVVHAEIKVGDSMIMLSDEWEEGGHLAPDTLGGTSVGLMVYLEDVDAVFARAIDKGATETRPVADQFYGDRTGTLVDPFGHRWFLSTHIEDVSPEELERRMQKSEGEAEPA